MKNHNCSTCVFKKVAFSDISNVNDMLQVEGTYFVKCLAGNDTKALEFHKLYSKIPYGGADVEMDCFEQTEVSKSMDRILGLADKLLNELRDSNGVK